MLHFSDTVAAVSTPRGKGGIAVIRISGPETAAVLGKAGEWGCLRVGGTADIAVLEHTNEAFSLTDAAQNRMEGQQGYRCVLTVSDGQIVYRD